MQVVIVSKTQMSTAICVGAIAPNGKYLRLLTEDGYNQPNDTPFNIRQVWDIEYLERDYIRQPHNEDVLVVSQVFKGILKRDLTMLSIVNRFRVPIWNGSPSVLFDGLLKWTSSGSGYINAESGIPNHSVGFWIPDKDLEKKEFHGIRYEYPNLFGFGKSIKYVGLETPISRIPAGSLVRVSLARWWDTNGTTEERCSLQLSGWYDIPAQQAPAPVQQPTIIRETFDEPDDLPF